MVCATAGCQSGRANMILVIGFIIGLALGLTGAGGSILAVPLLMLIVDLPINDAIGISLGTVSAAAIVGLISGSKTLRPNWHYARTLALSGMIAAPIGRKLSTFMPEPWLLIAFSLLAGFLALRMWRTTNSAPINSVITAATKRPTLDKTLLLCGLLCGLLAGLLGAGGGFIIIPLLTLYLGMDIKQATATSLLVVALISAAGFSFHVWLITIVDNSTLAICVIGGMAGALLGSQIAIKIVAPHLQKIFALCVITLMMVNLSQSLR